MAHDKNQCEVKFLFNNKQIRQPSPAGAAAFCR